MPNGVLERWTAEKARIGWDKWSRVEKSYLDTAGAKRSHIAHLAPVHAVFSPGFFFGDWVHFVPNGTVDRIRSTDDFESEYSAILQEIYDNIQQDSDDELIPLILQDGTLEDWGQELLQDDQNDWGQELLQDDTGKARQGAIKAWLCRVLSLQLRGTVNFEKVTTGQLDVPAEPSMDAPEQSALITVERILDLEHLEIAHFDIDDPSGFFGPRYGADTLMFERLLSADMTPETVEHSREVGSPIREASWQIVIGI
jgi:hypothetical protein